VDAQPKLFSRFCDDWLETTKATRKPQTWGNYRSMIEKRLKPTLGDFEVRDVTRADVQGLRDRLFKTKLSRKSVKNVFLLLHKLFEDATDLELAASNPAHKIKLDAPDDSIERHVPKPEDVLLTFAQLPPIYQALLATAAMTGARRGELLGLRWEDIDSVRGSVSIRRGLQRVNKKLLAAGAFRGVEQIGASGLALAAPKSKKPRPEMELPLRLSAMLQLLRRGQPESSFVFQDELGAPLDPDGFIPCSTRLRIGPRSSVSACTACGTSIRACCTRRAPR